MVFKFWLKLGLLEDYNPIDASLTWNEEGKNSSIAGLRSRLVQATVYGPVI